MHFDRIHKHLILLWADHDWCSQKLLTDQSILLHKVLFLWRTNSIFSTMEGSAFWVYPDGIRIDISKDYFQKSHIFIFRKLWNIWKNTDWSVVTFFLSTIFFVQGKHLRFFKVFKVCSVFDVLIKINIILSEKKPLKLLINLVGISVNCTIFVGSAKLIIFVILSFRTCWKEKEEFKFCVIFLIEIMLGWFWYLAIAFSIGSFSFSVFIMKLWLVFIPKVGTMFTKKLLKSSLILYHCL